MKNPLINTFAIIVILVLFSWNIYLSIQLNKYKRHPETVKIFLTQNDSITRQIESIQDSLGISIIVSEYNNDQLNNSLAVLSTTSNLFGKVLTALAIFVSILAALGLYEINTWKSLRKGIEDGEEKINNLTGRIKNSIEQIEASKVSFEQNINTINQYENRLVNKVDEFQKSSNEKRVQIENLIDQFNKNQDEIISNNFLFKGFKDNIFNQFQILRNRINKIIGEDLKEIKEANASEHTYPKELKNFLKEYLLFYNFFGSLLKAVSKEDLPLDNIDYFALGMASYFDNNYLDAQDFFEKAIKINPDDYVIHFRLGTVYFLQEKIEDAIASLEKSISIKPEFPSAYFNKGNAYIKIGKIEDAISAYKKAVLYNDKYLEAYNNLGSMYVKKENFNEALKVFNLILSIDHNYYKAYYNKACVYTLKKRKQEALLYLEKAIKLNQAFKKIVVNDKDFEWLKGDQDFLSLIK